jgi:2,3-dihydroxybiphenyl 1,2-dioxygenase
MHPQSLGYVGIRAKDLDDWARYGTGLLGLQQVDRSRGTLAFRMDDRKQRIVIDADGGEGISFFGWEVADAQALDALAAHLERSGCTVSRGSRALAEQRRVKDLIVFNDPMGNRLEIFHGPEVSTEAFAPGRNISGFRTGPLGMGHVVMQVANVDQMLTFYREMLGFRLSDYYFDPFTAYFLHLNPRHHSFALIQTGKNAVHHLMMELYSFDDVGQGYDLATAEEGRVATSLGRHTSDYLTSFYTWNPSGFMVEYGWGGRSIDPQTWQPTERKEGPSLWGHDRTWLPPEQREKARKYRLALAEDGFRRPVQVLEGNYELQAGVCPWWDSIKSRAVG